MGKTLALHLPPAASAAGAAEPLPMFGGRSPPPPGPTNPKRWLTDCLLKMSSLFAACAGWTPSRWVAKSLRLEAGLDLGAAHQPLLLKNPTHPPGGGVVQGSNECVCPKGRNFALGAAMESGPDEKGVPCACRV